MTDPGQHLDRRRAESFGGGATDYDRHRPPYAEALFDELAALAPASVLDVGCGTGHAAVPLAARGLDVLGVEPDERMAAVARAHGIRVETAPFEDWDDGGRRFDLLVCGSAWHWIDPERGVAKAAAVLRPGGTLARFWNYPVLEPVALERIERVYDELAPHLHRHGRRPYGGFADPVETSAGFGDVTLSVIETERAYSADEWVALVSTFSDHGTLDPGRRTVLLDALRVAIDDLGGSLRVTSCTHALTCRREPA